MPPLPLPPPPTLPEHHADSFQKVSFLTIDHKEETAATMVSAHQLFSNSQTFQTASLHLTLCVCVEGDRNRGIKENSEKIYRSKSNIVMAAP